MNEAVEIAKTFFKLTERRATSATMRATIAQANHLLTKGFTRYEIEIGIRYCINHPPRLGFNSLGWLSYDLENILVKVKVEQIKQQQSTFVQPAIINTVTPTIKQSKDRVSDEFDFEMEEEK